MMLYMAAGLYTMMQQLTPRTLLSFYHVMLYMPVLHFIRVAAIFIV
jgi:hypothetical protein